MYFHRIAHCRGRISAGICRKTATAVGMAALFAAATAVRSDWLPTAGGTYDYLDPGNWAGGTVDGVFPSSLTFGGAQIATFGTDHTAAGGLDVQYAGAYNLTLRGTGGARTLTLGDDVNVSPATNQTVTIGSTTASENLNLNLGGATRTLTVASGKTLSVLNTITNGTLSKAGGGTLIIGSGANYFTGDISIGGGTFTLRDGSSDATLGHVDNDLVFSGGVTFQPGSGNPISLIFHPLRDFDVTGNATFTRPYDTVFANIPGNIACTGTLTLRWVPLLSGSNTIGGAFAEHNGFLFSSHSNIGGPTSALTHQQYSSAGYGILGTNVTNLSQHTFTFAGDTPIIFDIQDPDNTFTWDKNYSSQANGASATYAFNKAGLGTLVVTTNQTYQNIQGAAIVTVLSGGTMKVDYPAGGRLNNVYNNIGFTGGTLHLLGKPDGTVTQTFQNVKLNAGGGTLIVDNQGGSGSTLANLGNFTSLAPVQGGGLDIRTVNAGSGSALVRSTGTNDATGLLGSGRVTLNGTDWAAVDATSNVVAYTGYTVGLPSSGSSPSVNYSHTDSASVTASESVNTLKLATTTGGQSLSIGAGQILTAGPVLFTGANDYTITGGSLAGALIAGGVSDFQIHHHGTGKLTIGSSITNGVGASILTIHGPGTTELTTANLYTGATRVNGGTLILSNNNQLNNGANTTLVLNGAKLKADDSITTSRTVTLGAGGATLDIATGKTLTLSGTVSGGRLILENSDAGSGLLVLGAVNSFASGVEVNGGVLRLNNNSALHALGLNTLQFGTASTQTLQIYGARTITVAGLKSDATTAVVENGATGAAILNVYNGADNRYTGVLRDGTVGTLALRKAGCGRLTLTGANTYTGTTTVWGGTLAVDGSLASASAVTVTRGALGGTGTAGGTVTVEAGGALAPGNGVGTLATGALTLNPGAILDYEMGSTGNADRVNVTGNLTLDGVLNVTDLAGFGAGQYTLITYTGTLTNNGLDVGTIPDDGLVYTVKTNTPGSVILSAAGPGSVILVR